jgi:hypothetical protein
MQFVRREAEAAQLRDPDKRFEELEIHVCAPPSTQMSEGPELPSQSRPLRAASLDGSLAASHK